MVLVGLDLFCAFEIVLSCLLGGKACTRWAEEVSEEEEVTGAVILLNSAECLGRLDGFVFRQFSWAFHTLEAQYYILGSATLLPSVILIVTQDSCAQTRFLSTVSKT